MNLYEQKRNYFSEFHPLTVFLYFILIIILSVILTNPFFRLCNLGISMIYISYLKGVRVAAINLKYSLPLFFMFSILNPLLNHNGTTVILYFNHQPVTLESFLYGVFTGIMVLSMIFWFQAFDMCLPSHKIIYLFGKRLPVLALMVTMILRYIPYLEREYETIRQTQSALGISTVKGNYRDKMKNAANLLSLLVSISLEGTIDTADSMNARGFRLNGKTHYQNYRFEIRDNILLLYLVLNVLLCAVVWLEGTLRFQYYPVLSGNTAGTGSLFLMIQYIILMSLPMLMNGGDAIRWRLLRSKI